LEQLLIGTLLPGAVPIQNKNINPVWRGNVQLDGIRRQMYVKSVVPRTLAVEVICSIIGRMIGLPIPRPAIVRVTSESLNSVTSDQVFFGSESIDNPDLKKWLSKDEVATMKRLHNWSKLLDAGCFDEWIANADRHGGNILYGGGSNFSLIDHSEALPTGLPVSKPAPANIVLSVAAENKTAKQLQDLYGKAKTCSYPFAGTAIQTEVQNILKAVCDHTTVEDLIDFLHQRVHSLLILISQRIGYKQDHLALDK